MQKFDSLILHDLPIKNLNLLFEEKKAIIVLEEYDDLTDLYQPLTLSFLGLHNFISKYPDKYEFSVVGCKDATCKKIKDGEYEALFALEMQDGQPVYSLTIGFTSLTINRTLSDKAIEYKKANLETRYEKIEWFEKNNLALPEWV
ncbi:MAG: hypothetical protein IPL26_11450 [Leptospiraceae bacterium]|nr:hypothetical protein [Leptospiraceae bacterium]